MCWWINPIIPPKSVSLFCIILQAMAQKYPVGIQDFSEVRTGGYVYVDKTPFIEALINQGKFYFLSRPRRFGKSLFVSALHYLFQGRKELFEGLYIENKWDWAVTNPVIKISFSNIGHKTMGLEKAIHGSLDKTAKQYNITFTQSEIDQKFKELIETLDAQHGKVVVLIDEYDKPIIDYLGTDTSKAIENRDIMKSFYSILKDADPHLKLVFITGVSKFSNGRRSAVSIFSDLNNLKDLSIDNNFESICGISQQELEDNFEKELEQHDALKIKKWYNGYSWGGNLSVYNPFSLLNFFAGDGGFKNYWFETGTPTFLIQLAKQQELYNFEGIEVGSNQLNAYDLENLQPIPLMFQTGYLTIKDYEEIGGVYSLDYPNQEVRQSYLDLLTNIYTQNPSETGTVLANNLRKILLKCELEKLQSLLNTIFKSIPYEVWQKENEHFYHAIIHLTFRLLGIYVESQVQTSDGRIDALVKVNEYVYAFEFKLDGSATKALQQIKDKGYLQPYQNQDKKCIGIGVNFSTQLKKVEEILWEEING
jgi:Predicted AAA-ATPase/PD-(D/E)XK nuclease superfamily